MADPLHIALLQPFPPPVAARIRALVAEAEAEGGPRLRLDMVAEKGTGPRRAALALADYAVVVTEPLDRDDLDHAPRLRLVHKWGAGTDNLPLGALAARGLPVLRTAGTNAPYVAELALALMLSVLRNVTAADRSLRSGRWTGPEQWTTSRSLHGRSVGLVGFGPTAVATARLLRAFGSDVIYTARTRRPEAVERQHGVRYLPLAALLGSVDVVSLHVPLTAETRGLIDAAALAAMRPSAVLVDLSRGGVVDEVALLDALATGRLGGAGLDVFEREPLPAGHPFLTLPNVVLTPHIGGKLIENLEATVRHWLGNIMCHARGEPLPADDLVRVEGAAGT